MTTILIVDDDRALRRALATYLCDLGHGAAEAGDGEAALAWLSRHHADAVLLDLRMPGMDGMEVLQRIRRKPNPPPVAVLTTVPTSDNTIEATRLGAADHLAKPIGRDGLQALLGRMLPAAGASSASSTMARAREDKLDRARRHGMGPAIRVADGSDEDRVGAWPENFVCDTRLGPNRNGRHW